MSEFERLWELVSLAPGDRVVVVSDTGSDQEVGRLLFESALSAGTDAVWTHVRARPHNGDELPDAIRAAVRESDLVVLATSWSPSHSRGIVEAMEGGARVMSMPGLTAALVGAGAMTADYERVKALTDRFGEHFSHGRTIELATAAGTRLSAELGGWSRLPFLDGGPLPRDTGGLGNFPAGETAIAPIEGTAAGRVVVDLTVSTTPTPLTTPIELTISGGAVADVAGGAEADALRRFLDEAGESARVVAEIALGTNDRALHVGIVLEDEKKLGTAHVGLGNARAFGGLNESPVHIDAIFDRVTAHVDGVALVVEGEPAPGLFRRESLSAFDGRPGPYVRAPAATEVREGRLHVCWHDVRGFPLWAQVGDDEAARAATELLAGGVLSAPAGTEAARVLELLERYRVVVPAGPERR